MFGFYFLFEHLGLVQFAWNANSENSIINWVDLYDVDELIAYFFGIGDSEQKIIVG